MTTGSQRETSRQRRQRETQHAILDAAHALFCKLGYADCSIDRIAAAAGFTKGAVYGLFDSKEDLFLALIEDRSRSVLSEVTEVLPAGASGEVLVHALGQWLARKLDEERDWCLVNAEFALLAARRPALARQRRAALNRSTDELVRLLERIAPDVSADPDLALASRVILSVVDGLALHHAVDENLDVATAFSLAVRRLAFPAPSARPSSAVADPVSNASADK